MTVKQDHTNPNEPVIGTGRREEMLLEPIQYSDYKLVKRAWVVNGKVINSCTIMERGPIDEAVLRKEALFAVSHHCCKMWGEGELVTIDGRHGNRFQWESKIIGVSQ